MIGVVAAGGLAGRSVVPGGSLLRPGVLDEDAGLVCARLSTLLALGDPVEHDLWRVGVVTAADVAAARAWSGLVAREGLCEAHAGTVRVHDPLARPVCRRCEVGRVAWFAARGDGMGDVSVVDRFPVTFDAGFGAFVPDWPFTDGNHRLAALSLTVADPSVVFVPVEVAGDWDRGLALLVEERDPVWVYENL